MLAEGVIETVRLFAKEHGVMLRLIDPSSKNYYVGTTRFQFYNPKNHDTFNWIFQEECWETKELNAMESALTEWIGKSQEEKEISGAAETLVSDFCHKLRDEVLRHKLDLVADVKCPDGEYRSRPLLDVATVLNIIEDTFGKEFDKREE